MHHVAVYTGVNAADIAHAIARLRRVCQALIEVCADVVKKAEDLIVSADDMRHNAYYDPS